MQTEFNPNHVATKTKSKNKNKTNNQTQEYASVIPAVGEAEAGEFLRLTRQPDYQNWRDPDSVRKSVSKLKDGW